LNVFNSGQYNFIYTALVIDKIAKGGAYLNALYKLAYTPTCYFDGGHDVLVGGTAQQSYYTSRISAAAVRDVPDLDLDVSMTYIDTTHVEFTVSITNNNFVNVAPDIPQIPDGPATGLEGVEVTFSASATDPDGDQLYYMWDWGADTSAWLGPYNSGETATAGHTWTTTGEHSIAVKVKDEYDEESPWSSSATIALMARGDANGDGDVNIGDAVSLINYIFKGGPAPDPIDAGDSDCDAAVNIGDAVYLINYIFKGGPAPGC
jgi:hypothetical protein